MTKEPQTPSLLWDLAPVSLSQGISESDIRKIARLLGRLVTAKGNHNSKRRRLLNGLAHLIRADSWSWELSDVDSAGRNHVLGLLHSVHNEQPASFRQPLPLLPPNDFSEVSSPQTHTGQRLQNTSSCPALCFENHVPGVGLSKIGMFRDVSSPTFSAHDGAVFELVLSEIRWVHTPHGTEHAADAARSLSPRLSITLHYLLQGNSRKQIADLLSVELNTVHGYVRDLYLVFQVNSQVSLLRECAHDAIRKPNTR